MKRFSVFYFNSVVPGMGLVCKAFLSSKLSLGASMFLVNHGQFVLIRSEILQVTYLYGAYDADEGYISLNKEIGQFEKEKNHDDSPTRRLFYFALPPSVYPLVSERIRKHCMNQSNLCLSQVNSFLFPSSLC